MCRSLIRGVALTATAWLWLTASQPASAQEYTIRPLGNTVNEAGGISNQGLIAGSAESADGNHHAFRWGNGILRELGTLGGFLSEGYGINDLGDVVGLAETTAGDYHAFISINGGALRDIDGRANRYSEAWAIHGSTVVGLAETNERTEPRTFHAFVWNGGALNDLGTLGGQDSIAFAINSHGQVSGGAQSPNTHYHAAVWTAGKITDLGLLSLGLWSYAFGINDSGRVVGVAQTNPSTSEFHAVLWDNGVIRDLGTLLGGLGRHSEALAVNAGGQVVGWSSVNPQDTIRHAFIWENGSLRDLNSLIPSSSGWELHRAIGINDLGQIVGEGTLNGNAEALFVLTPLTAVSSRSLAK